VGFFYFLATYGEVIMAEVAQPTNEVLSRKQAAKFLGVCTTTLDRMKIPKTQIRRRVLYRQSVLLKWLEKNTEGKM
jgi:hypothetical protein